MPAKLLKVNIKNNILILFGVICEIGSPYLDNQALSMYFSIISLIGL